MKTSLLLRIGSAAWLAIGLPVNYRLQQPLWEQVVGAAQDISVAPDGSVWRVGTEPQGEFGFGVWRYSAGGEWLKIGTEGLIRMDAGLKNEAWGLNAEGGIYRWLGKEWELMPGLAHDIGLGADGVPWIVTQEPHGAEGCSIARWDGKSWQNVAGMAGWRIDVGADGYPWVCTRSGAIYHYDSQRWQFVAGRAHDISIGPTGEVWIAGGDKGADGFSLYQLDSAGKWIKQPGATAMALSVGPENEVWIADSRKQVFHLRAAVPKLPMAHDGNSPVEGE